MYIIDFIVYIAELKPKPTSGHQIISPEISKIAVI